MTHDEPVITSAAAHPPPTEAGRSALAPSLGDMPEPSVALRRLLARDDEPDGPGFQSSI